MYVHIGAERDILDGKIIGIFNYQTIGNIKDICCNANCDIIDISEGKPASVILTAGPDKEDSAFHVYISMVSCNTLVERINRSI